jgi:hypothetical protein
MGGLGLSKTAYPFPVNQQSFWKVIDGKAFCPNCLSPVKLWNPPYEGTLTLIIDGEEVEQTPEEWTSHGLDQLKTICNECEIFLYDPNEEIEED